MAFLIKLFLTCNFKLIYGLNLFPTWIFGYVAALYLVIWIVKKSEKSSNSITMLSGTVFAFLYMMYGFEHIIQITYVVWAVSSIWTFIRSKFKLVHGR